MSKIWAKGVKNNSGFSMVDLLMGLAISGMVGLSLVQTVETSSQTEYATDRLASVNTARGQAAPLLSSRKFVDTNAGKGDAGSKALANCLDGEDKNTVCEFNKNIPVTFRSGGNRIAGSADKEGPAYFSARTFKSCSSPGTGDCLVASVGYFNPVCVGTSQCKPTDLPNFVRTEISYFAIPSGADAADTKKWLRLSSVTGLVDTESKKAEHLATAFTCPSQILSGFKRFNTDGSPAPSPSYQQTVGAFKQSKMLCNDVPSSADAAAATGKKGKTGSKGAQGAIGPVGPTGPVGSTTVVYEERPTSELSSDELLSLQNLEGQSQILTMHGDEVAVVNKFGEHYSFGRGYLVEWAVRGGGCFVEGTKIKMASGEWRAIETLRKGEAIWNGINGQPARILYGTRGPEAEALVHIQIHGKDITVTGGHPMMSASGLKTARTLVATDRLLWQDGSYQPIERLERTLPAANTMVYNLELERGDNTSSAKSMTSVAIVAGDGLVTGDLKVQKMLEGTKPALARLDQ